MKLSLNRPLVFFDVETTGLNVGKDRIIELALLKIYPDGKEEEKVWRINSEFPISKEAEAVHGISNKDLENEPVFSEIADEVLLFLENCDLAGYNSNKFDLPLLIEEFLRIGKDFELRDRMCIDVQNIFHKMEPRNLSAAYRFYCFKELIDAHQALADTRATFEVLKGQLAKYEGETHIDTKTGKATKLENNVKLLSEFSRENRSVDFAGHIVFNEKDEEVFNFGKYKGIPVKKVFTIEPPYYDWMMKADFPLYTKKIISKIYRDLKMR
ncbi:MAG: 3'-5' exonuclease [Bacteroidales bacterium]|jgi:DNA polymerase-3 subunit epsilon|nr:3'-5' exonuclease [Bacteroidales bacterium]